MDEASHVLIDERQNVYITHPLLFAKIIGNKNKSVDVTLRHS